MKYLLIGDPHFTPGNGEFTQALQRRACELAPRVDHIIVLGDVLDTFERTNTLVLQRALKFLYALADIKPTICIIGNHDLPSDRHEFSDIHAFYGQRYPQLTFVDTEPMELDGCLYVPYLPPGRFFPALQERGYWPKNYEYIFCHQEFAGTVYDGGDVSRVEEDIPDEFTGMIISGHIHKSQHREKILYVGTPYQTSFGEDEHKGLYILDRDKGTFALHHLRYAPVRRTLQISYTEFLAYDWTTLKRRSIYRIQVVCSNSSEQSAVRKHRHTQELRGKGHHVFSILCDEVKVLQLTPIKPQLNFKLGLHGHLKNNAPHLIKLFDQL